MQNKIMNSDECIQQLVALTLVPEMGPVTFRKLLDRFGSLSGIFKADSGKLKKIPRLAKGISEGLKAEGLLAKAEEELKFAEAEGVNIVSFFDENYPALLKEIANPPILLYVKGTLPSPGEPSVAVVGSRVPSIYGQQMAKTLAQGLAEAGVVVVSGMAIGIDTAAHEGALSANGITLAVLGSGLAQPYPSENKKLMSRIAQKGAVISEFPMRMRPSRENFPIRNRIISGLSQGVLVVEAKEKSGALITVDAALEQGRDVYAVPGNADSLRSRGTNRLLKQGAKLVTEAQDILDELQLKQKKSIRSPKEFNPEETRLLSLMDSESLTVDDLIEKSQIPANRVVSTLSRMEIKHYVKQLPGKNFIRTTEME